jgi:O-antigen ligase
MKILRIGICVLLTFAVLAYGGVEDWSQAILEVCFAALLVIWALRTFAWQQEVITISPLLRPLLVFLLVTLVQLVFHRTASPYDTRMQLQLLITYIILLILLPQAYYRMNHWRGLLWFLMSLGFFVSVFGILQQLTFNGKLYWFRVMRYGGHPFGPYVNRNHFAGFAEILIPVALVPLVLGKVRRERLFLVGLFAVVPIVALLLSASRGGIISFAVELVILFSLLLVRRLQSKYMLAGGVLVLCAILAVSWIGVQEVLQRFSNYESLDVTVGKRASMRHDTFRIFLDHPALGTGLGTFQMVFPPYESNYDARIVNHAHNDYLEVLAETGLAGGICCLWFLAILFIESVKGLKDLGGSFGAALNLSGLVGCCGLLVHSLVDFNLHIPANALLFFVSAHLATTRLQTSTPGMPESDPPRREIRKVEGS